MVRKENYKTILQTIGSTPLARLELGVKPLVLAKLEFLNPGGSIKDRSALFMVEEAEREGWLKPKGTIIEASSGNQGIALAMIGAVKGYKVIITVPDRTAIEKIEVLRAYGAEVHVCPNTDDLHDPRGYHAMAEHFVQTIPGAFMPNQYFNKSNPLAHYSSTGPEIWQQTNGTLTHFMCGAGSCGTISGVGRYLKGKNSSIKVIGIDAATSAYSSKEPKAYQAEGIGIDVISDTFAREYIDEIMTVTDEQAFTMTRRLAKEYGLLVGISSGAVMAIALEYAKGLKETDTLVVILADSGKSYLNKVFMKKETAPQNASQVIQPAQQTVL
jgi:cystathionine beta-synthase